MMGESNNGNNVSLILKKRRMKDFDLEAEDWKDLMERCLKLDVVEPYNWEIVIQLLAAGARKREVVQLTYADLDVQQIVRTIEVVVPTKKKHRMYLVHLSGTAEELALKVLGIQNLMRTLGESAPVFRPDVDRSSAMRILSIGVKKLLSHPDTR
jgi:integrase